MKYNFNYSNNSIAIGFKNKDREVLLDLLKSIYKKYIYSDCYYNVQIKGLKTTVDDFFEHCLSRNICVKRDVYNKTLFFLDLISNKIEDLILFNEYIGSFNEGFMVLYFFKSSYDLKSNNQKN